MKKNEELFYLIQSLSKSEKRYFKLSAGGQDDAEYLQLFDAIESQKVYDEALIKEQFKHKAFVVQLTTIKNYLKQRILLSLRGYHAKLSVQAELLDILRNIEILYNKGLYEICNAEIKRAEKKAEKFQQNNLLYQILEWKQKIQQLLFPYDQELQRLVFDQQKKCLAALDNYTKLSLAAYDSDHLITLQSKVGLLENKTLKVITDIRRTFLDVKTPANRPNIEALLREWDERRDLLELNAVTYLQLNNTYLESLIFVKNYKGALVRIQLLKKKIELFEKTSVPVKKELLSLFLLELEVYRHLTSLHHIEEEIEKIKLFWNENSSTASNEQKFRFFMIFMLLFFQKRRFPESGDWALQILESNEVKQLPFDVLEIVYWVVLIKFFEEKNEENLLLYVNKFRKVIKSNKNIDFYERRLFSFLKRQVGKSTLSHQEELIKLQAKLEETPIPNRILLNVDIMSWIKEHF